MTTTELDNLERISKDSRYAEGPNAATTRYCFRIIKRYLTGNSILELGPAEGVMTDLLMTTGKKLTVVEGSSTFCDDLRRRHPSAHVVHSLFEDFITEETFDTIILGHVLEHVVDPVEILKLVKTWLSPQGRVFAAVPNARSLHRQAAVLMNLLASEDSLNEMDLHHGHRRVFHPESFRNSFIQAGLQLETFGGYWLKPVSNRQIETSWNTEMLDAFMSLGERYPDIAGEIYVVGGHPTHSD